MLTNDQIIKLPLKVQYHISKLQADMEYYRNAIEKMGSGKTRVVVGWEELLYVPDNQTIRFLFPRMENDPNPNYVSVRFAENGLFITSTDFPMLIEPSASNAIYIQVGKI